jgi:prepilin-type N-terminal cleavage/methylation domain-containing protein
MNVSKGSHPRAGVSLTELMCVLAILSILFSLYLGSILRAYLKIMAFIKTLQ